MGIGAPVGYAQIMLLQRACQVPGVSNHLMLKRSELGRPCKLERDSHPCDGVDVRTTLLTGKHRGVDLLRELLVCGEDAGRSGAVKRLVSGETGDIGIAEWALNHAGRHNALDKAIGKCLLSDTGTAGRGVALTSRLSLEMVGKCARAGIELITAVSAPTSMAIDVANHCNITLCAFVRETRATVFTHPARVVTTGA